MADASFLFFVLTLFSRNHSNPRAVGTSWRLKGHLFNGDWLIVCFCCVSSCSVLYDMFITLFQNISVNAQPSSPSFFAEIAAHKKGEVFFSLLCLRLRLFYFCLFLLIFGNPLPTPWTRLAPFGIDVGTIFGIIFPRFRRPR